MKLLQAEPVPAYLYDDDNERYYLNLNKDIHGDWSIGYMNYKTGLCWGGENGFKTVEAALSYIEEMLDETPAV